MISILSIFAAIFRWRIDQIFIVNIIGCFFLGFINTLNISKSYKLIFGFGFCGSLTTFSGLSLYLFQLLNEGFYQVFFVDSVSMILLGFFAVSLGHLFAKKINT